MISLDNPYRYYLQKWYGNPLSAGYDSGLRASKLVAIEVEHIIEAIDPDARLLSIKRSKGDQEGEGATAYISPRTVRAIAAWLEAAGIEA